MHRQYYTEVTEDNKPKNLIEYCFRCRIMELRQENLRRFRELNDAHHALFRAYLANDPEVPESKIRDALKNGGFDFKLKHEVYLVHEYDPNTFAQDIISGFATGRYDHDSMFSTIRSEDDVYDNHAVSGSHMYDDIKLDPMFNFARHAISMIHDIDLDRFGDDLMELAVSCVDNNCQGLISILIDKDIEYPFEALCQAAATDLAKFKHIYQGCVEAYDEPNMNVRNMTIADRHNHIHPEHKRIGLNIMDILILLNRTPDIHKCLIKTIHDIDVEDLRILVKSLKYWIEHVSFEDEFELIRQHVKCLEEIGYPVNLFD